MDADQVVGARSGVVLSPISSRLVSGVSDELMSGVHEWVRSFLGQPHHELGRTGAVCPFSGPSLSRDLFWVGEVKGSDIDVERMRAVADDIIDAYHALPPREGQEAIFKAIVVVFPDLTDYSIIDIVQREGKSMVVRDGMMLGQFYPGCAQPGLWNHDFRPLDAPYPMLAVRQMVSSDFAFLTADREWLMAYFKRFAPGIPLPVRSTIIEHLLPAGDLGR
jgi:hypothetical protein